MQLPSLFNFCLRCEKRMIVRRSVWPVAWNTVRSLARLWRVCCATHHRVNGFRSHERMRESVNLGDEGRRAKMNKKKHREALYTALILDSNGCSRVVHVLVIAKPFAHGTCASERQCALDDNVAVGKREHSSRLPSTAGVLHYTSRYRNGHDSLTPRWILSCRSPPRARSFARPRMFV